MIGTLSVDTSRPGNRKEKLINSGKTMELQFDTTWCEAPRLNSSTLQSEMGYEDIGTLNGQILGQPENVRLDFLPVSDVVQ